MIALELLLLGTGLLLANAGWDTIAASRNRRRCGVPRAGLGLAFLLLFPALCCWTLVITSATIRLAERPAGPPSEQRLALAVRN